MMADIKILEGFRIVEQGGFITGPYAAMLLADMGAEVIKVERPDGGDPFRNFEGGLYSPHFQAYNRNKKSLTLDTRQADDRATLDDLIRTADVFIQNFRPGVAAKLGVDAERLRTVNPALVYCSISGFGPTGPYVSRPSYDTVAQALSGFLNMFLDPADPRISGPALADAVTGLYAAQGILGALLRRERAGEGRLVEVSMLEAMTHFAIEPYSNYFANGRTPGPFGRAAVSQSYVARCADGGMVSLHLSSPEKFWTGLLAALDRPDIDEDRRFSTRQSRVDNHAALIGVLQEAFLAKPRDVWIDLLTAQDVPCAPVYDLDEALADPQARHLGLELSAEHPVQGTVRTIRPAIGFDGQTATSFAPPPTLGEHNDLVRADLASSNRASLGAKPSAKSSRAVATA
jgi:crotonobetainyl-CoA:carnitine CoA-transferase CaiB-like acyl-CoA transferase